MSLLCKLTRNISLNNSSSSGGEGGSSVGCNSTDISMGVGGIRTPVYVYNISDIENLKFENDNRSDYSLVVDTIITSAPFYSIDFTNATYQEDYDDGKWTHSIELSVNNINQEFEDLLSDSVAGRYLVAFRPNGDVDYRMFGWKQGASLTYSLGVSEDSQGYTIRLEDVSEYPLFSVYSDNFNTRDKVYTPIFKPLYSAAYCEIEGGMNDGFAVAMYVVKVNAAGQALDRNNKLCQWSGLKQDAYKLNLIQSDGGYNIIGEYESNAWFEGLPVRIYDLDLCPAYVEGTILINGKSAETLNLNSVTVSSSVTISSENSWTMLSTPNYVTISPTNGVEGNTIVTVYHQGVGGSDEIVFQNRRTKERVTLTVNVNIIKINNSYVFPYGTTQFILTPQVQGGSADYTYTVSPSLSVTKDSNGYLVCSPSVSENEQNFTFVLTHSDDSNEVKQVNVKILGNNANPSWQVLDSFCEII